MQLRLRQGCFGIAWMFALRGCLRLFRLVCGLNYLPAIRHVLHRCDANASGPCRGSVAMNLCQETDESGRAQVLAPANLTQLMHPHFLSIAQEEILNEGRLRIQYPFHANQVRCGICKVDSPRIPKERFCLGSFGRSCLTHLGRGSRTRGPGLRVS